MTETNTATSPTALPQAPTEEDPRYAFAKVVDIVGNLIESTTPDMVGNATPCPDFTVKELMEHMVFVVRSVASLGRGEPWSTVEQQATNDGWAQDYRDGAHAIMQAWADPAILDQLFEVPWGVFPGAVVMHTYTAELATHGWDLAQATGRELAIDDELLHGALIAMQFVPADERDDPDMPFATVVDPGPDAPVLLQVAGWSGRNVLA